MAGGTVIFSDCQNIHISKLIVAAKFIFATNGLTNCFIQYLFDNHHIHCKHAQKNQCSFDIYSKIELAMSTALPYVWFMGNFF